ncbi:MAG: MFS transporter [Firmicutes bacterium]|nr:MFS transporter [Bacillota bacterium]
MERKYKRTLIASYVGYITQAIVNNLAPLLFVIFQKEYGLTVAQIGFLVTFNFGVQIAVDLLSARFAERIGYRRCIVAAHIFSAVGLIGLGVFPDVLGSPYAGLLLAVAVYAVGGGLIEVLVSPIVEALPTEGKSAAMSLLHSFYCWGHALVVILTTVFFRIAGTESWRLVTALWALVPLANVFLFASSPIRVLTEAGEALPMRKLLSMGLFWLFVLLMICSGAAEQAMSQWASYFAERGLGVSKTAGDLLGPCSFALLMGLSRWFYGTKGGKIPLETFILCSDGVCIVSYLIAVFSPMPLVSLIGCGLCGLSVGIMWPGVFSLSASRCAKGGTAMFALLALAGDVGCASGPTVVGTVSQWFGGELKAGLLAAVAFPMALMIGILILNRCRKAESVT